jgi:uncharacterized protein DUF6232
MDQLETWAEAAVREQYGWWRGVQVTNTTMTVGDLTYEIDELRWLRVERGRPPMVRRVVLSVAATQAAIVALALAALAQMNGVSTMTYLGGVAQMVFTTVLVGVTLVIWPRPLELWAEYRGEPTMLYGNGDRYEFGKVHRAVRRAMLWQRMVK